MIACLSRSLLIAAQGFHFQPGKRLHPRSLGAEEERVFTGRMVSLYREFLL